MTEVRRTSQYRRPNPGGVIDTVRPGSLADEIGLLPGDRVVAIDGKTLQDAVDFQFHAAEESIALEVVRGEQPYVFEIEKHPDEDLGIDFQDAAFDGVRICNNACFFCFLKGNPKGMRKTLYVKDDDYRLSFFHGNFVTLTNLTEDDWLRLAEQRLSPINVSVHATEPALRRYMLGNDTAVLNDIFARINGPNATTRIRGLEAADNARDFFPTLVPWDSYNSSRIEIERGVNSILAGNGSGAGIINSTPDDAMGLSMF